MHYPGIIDSSTSIYFDDLLTGKFSNYVIQRVYQKCNLDQKAIILNNVKMTLETVEDLETSPLRHVLIFLETKCDIDR